MGGDEIGKTGGLTRREWVRLGATFGIGAAAGAFGAYQFGRLLEPPRTLEGEVRDAIFYEVDGVVPGKPVRVTDFTEWQGVKGVWRGLFVATPGGHSYVAGTGFPVLVIRVKRDDAVFSAPSPAELTLPKGFALYYDDPVRDIRIVVAFDRCTHLCCKAGWHTIPVPAAYRDYIARSPTYEVFGQDPIYCACHDAQFDPMVLVKDEHPSGVTYVGAQRVHGPAPRALPVVPVRAEADILIGGMPDPGWYTSYCR